MQCESSRSSTVKRTLDRQTDSLAWPSLDISDTDVMDLGLSRFLQCRSFCGLNVPRLARWFEKSSPGAN